MACATKKVNRGSWTGILVSVIPHGARGGETEGGSFPRILVTWKALLERVAYLSVSVCSSDHRPVGLSKILPQTVPSV
jgi:hypothetical protein